ncbi:MAG: EAL domain-containing protein [Ketobacter sp.]|nr:MAG: EAL domain-containing protein [Ketobacter sp.]
MTWNVLYAEDDRLQSIVVSSLLQQEGFTVTHVENGKEALNALPHSDFDVILTDHYMPEMSGVELLSEIRVRQYDIPLVLMTSAQDMQLVFSAVRAGAADFISKDLKGQYLELIVPVLLRACDRHHLQARVKQHAELLEREKNLCYKTLDAMDEGVIVINEEFRITYQNNFFSEIINGDLDRSLLGWDVSTLISLFRARVDHCFTDASLLDEQAFIAWLRDGDGLQETRLGDRILEVKKVEVAGSGYAIAFVDVTQQKTQLATLDETVTLAPIAMLAIDANGCIVLANLKACELIGLEKDLLLGCSINNFVPSSMQESYYLMIERYFQAPKSRLMHGGMELQLINAEGKLIPVEISISGMRTRDEVRVLASIVDISQRKEAEQALIQAHQLTQSIIDNSPFSIVATDMNGVITAVSPALEKMLHFDKEELIQQRSVLMFHDEEELAKRASMLSDEMGCDVQPNFDLLVLHARDDVVKGQEWTYRRKDGARIPVNVTVTTLRSHDETITGFLLVAYDITAQKQASEYIQYVAHHDELTGLPNRTLMRDRLENALRRVRRTGSKMGVLVLDLDHFKRINDSLGHVVGDELLKTVALRLVSAVRDSDTVCRMGGDEFVVILPDVHKRQDVERVCLKILELVAQPIQVGLNTLNVTPSIGLSMAPDDGETEDDLLKHADIAMYRAKHTGRNGYYVFSQEMAKANHDEMMIEQALHQAFLNNRLQLHYQPQVDINTRKVNGFEALIRWIDPVHGAIAPDRFIPMAETTGYIFSLGEWVLNRACQDMRKLREKNGLNYRVSVNVSPRQLEQPGFVDTVRKALHNSGLPPQALELEITEGVLVAESGMVLQILNELHAMGVLLAIDDFGTGFCSLAYLAQYPINVIKIDRCFIDVDQKSSRAIVGAITTIAEGLGLEVVAEGVETLDQIELVRDRGCSVVQGFYFYEAMSLDDLTPLLLDVSNDVERKLALH